MDNGTLEPRTHRARWRLPVFGFVGAILGFVLFLAFGDSGNTDAELVANVPGLLFASVVFHAQPVDGLPAQALIMMAVGNVAAWVLLGLAAGVAFAALRRPRQIPRREGTR